MEKISSGFQSLFQYVVEQDFPFARAIYKRLYTKERFSFRDCEDSGEF